MNEAEEFLQNYIEEQKKAEEIENRWISKFINLSMEVRISLINKIIEKYDSDAYRNREYKSGYEPRTELFWLYLVYAEKYGKSIYDEYSIKYPDSFYFTSECILTPENFVVERLDGQGSVVFVAEFEKFKNRLIQFAQKHR